MSILLMLLYLVLPCAFWFANVLIWKRRVHWFLLLVIATMAGYLVFVGAAWVADVELRANLARFDRDGNGDIDNDEMSPEAERAVEDYYSDTGRVMAPFLGGPLTLIWCSMQFSVLGIGTWLLRLATGSQRENAAPPASESGNPFRAPVQTAAASERSSETPQPADDGS